MIRTLFCITILIFITSFSTAQSRSEDYKITLPEQKIPNSLYNTIQFLDSRYDTTFMGIIQKGPFNKRVKVVPKDNFSIQLPNVLHALIDSSAKDGALLFQLRQFNFAEITGGMSERGYCYVRACLYANKNGLYQKINSIDTVIVIKSLDVTKSLLRHGSSIISNFIADNITQEANGLNDYSYNDIEHIDSIEKRSLNAYNATTYNDGLYLAFSSFMDQKPDKQAIVEMKKEKISSVTTLDENGKIVKVKAKNMYAIVEKGVPFIATDYGYYPLQKIDDDFLFTGKAKVTANSADVMAATLFFGIIGGLIASNAEATFEMKIDHINGGFIRLRAVADN